MKKLDILQLITEHKPKEDRRHQAKLVQLIGAK